MYIKPIVVRTRKCITETDSSEAWQVIVANFSKMESFALVYLNSAKKYITVQESFVYDLNQQKLKNNGVNRNQMFKIFWSNNANCEIPDFDAEISDVHPPLAENACYSGRLYKFYGTYFSFYFVFYEIAK